MSLLQITLESGAVLTMKIDMTALEFEDFIRDYLENDKFALTIGTDNGIVYIPYKIALSAVYQIFDND